MQFFRARYQVDGVYGFDKDIDIDLFQLGLYPSLYMDFLFTDRHDKDTAKFEKAKVQNSVGLKYKFYKAMLKVSSFREASVGQQNWTAGIPLKKRTAEGTPSHHHYFAM